MDRWMDGWMDGVPMLRQRRQMPPCFFRYTRHFHSSTIPPDYMSAVNVNYERSGSATHVVTLPVNNERHVKTIVFF